MSSYNAFRQTRQQAKKKAPKGRKRRAYTEWLYRINGGEKGDQRILDPGEGGFRVEQTHWVNRKPHVCTKNHPLFNGQCVYCHYWEVAPDNSDDKDNLYPGMKRIIELIDFRYFHRTTDKDDNPIINICSADGPRPKHNRCRMCKNSDAVVAERHFSGHKRWELGKNLFNQVAGYHDELTYICIAETEDGGVCNEKLYPISYVCGECKEHEFVEERELETIDEEQLFKIIDEEQKCPGCDHEGFPVELVICESGNHDAVRGSIYDQTVRCSCSSETIKDKNGKEKTNYTFNFTSPNDWCHVSDELSEQGFDDEAIEKMLEPLDFAKIYCPERVDPEKYDSEESWVGAVLDSQAETLKRKNPFGGSSRDDGKPASRPFRRNRSASRR